jgi:hypothetical protein
MTSPRTAYLARSIRDPSSFLAELRSTVTSMNAIRDLARLEALGPSCTPTDAGCTPTDTIVVELHRDPRFLAIRDRWLAEDRDWETAEHTPWWTWLVPWRWV